MRRPYIFLLLLIFATSLGVSGCSLMEQFRNPNSLARRVGNFSPTKLDSDKAEMQTARDVTPLIRGSRDLDGRQEQFDPAFGAPETQAELNQERAEMNSARSAAQTELTPLSRANSAQTPSPGGVPGVANSGGPAPGSSADVMNASVGAQFGKPGMIANSKANQFGSSKPANLQPSSAVIGSSSSGSLGSSKPAIAQSEKDSQSGKTGTGKSTLPFGETGFVGKGSQFGSPNTANIAPQKTSAGKMSQPSSVPEISSSSLKTELIAGRTKISDVSSKQNSNIVQTPDSSRFGLAHGNVKPTTFAPTRSATPVSDMPSTANVNQNQGFGCPPAGMVSLGGGTSRSPGSNRFDTIASTPRSSFPTATPSYTSPPPYSSSIPSSPNAGASPSFDSSLPPINSNTMPPGAGPSPSINVSRLDSPKVETSNGWDFKNFRLPSFKFPFFPFSSPKPSKSSNQPSESTAGANDLEIVNAQNNHSRNVMVTITAVVKKLLPDDTKGSPHQRFLLELSNGTTVLVAHNTSLAPHVPLREGDFVTISGEYIWNEKGGVLHYTHHTTNRKHRGGYIEYNRQTYQ